MEGSTDWDGDRDGVADMEEGVEREEGGVEEGMEGGVEDGMEGGEEDGIVEETGEVDGGPAEESIVC